MVMTIVPVVIVAGIGVYVIESLKHKYNQGNLGKKKSEDAQGLLDSSISIGMIFGCALGVIFGAFYANALIYAVSLGTGIGYLLGFFAYNSYSKKGN